MYKGVVRSKLVPGLFAVLAVLRSDTLARPVDLELRPVTPTVEVGETVDVGLYAVSADGPDQTVGFVGAILLWDETALVLTGESNAGAFAWGTSGFPSESGGLNITFSDGDAYFQAIVSEGGPLATATSDGALVTTFQFTALSAATGPTPIMIETCVAATCSRVLDRHPFDAGVEDVTGDLGVPVEVTILCQLDSQCDDENPCTDDSCNAGSVCTYAPNDNNDPDDGLFCNGHEICDGGQVVIEPGSLPECDDSLSCTTDGCNDTTDQCYNELDNGYCLIGGECRLDSFVNPTSECEACDSALDPGDWSPRPSGALCGDRTERECDGADRCDGAAVCLDNLTSAGTPCGNPSDTECSAPDTCDGAGACSPNHVADATPCDDGLFCMAADTCLEGRCSGVGTACPGQVCDETTDRCKAVNIELRPLLQGPHVVGETVEIDLYAVADGGVDQPIAGLDVVMSWDGQRLELMGAIDNGPYDWSASGFPDDSILDGLNDTFLDGNALYEASGPPPPSPPALATPQGLWVTTFQLRALTAGRAHFEILRDLGQFSETKVLDGETLGLDILGSVGPEAAVDIIECLEDPDCDDGEFCTGVATCLDTVCVAGSKPNCADGIFCNGTEICEPGVGCVSPGSPCPDPDSCDEDNGNCGGCDAPAVRADGTRYLAVTPVPGNDPVALLVTGDPKEPAVSCASMYVQADGTLDITPMYLTPAEWGTVHVADIEIIPSTVYYVQADCRPTGVGYLSHSVPVETWLWGDVNDDGVVQIDDVILVYDGSQGIFPQGITLENLDMSPCQPDRKIDADDIVSVESAFFGSPFPCSAPCDACMWIEPPRVEPSANPKNRYVSFEGGNTGERTAMRVKFANMPPPFDARSGETMWVGQPEETCENSGQGIDVPAPQDCAPVVGPSPTLWSATLQCEPYYADWTAYGTVNVYHASIVPGGTYAIQTIREGCGLTYEGNYSTPLSVTQALWGDVCGPSEAGACTAPADGVVDVTNDVLGLLAKFANTVALNKANADLEPATPDLKVNVANDVLYCLDAFLGSDYPFQPALPCP